MSAHSCKNVHPSIYENKNSNVRPRCPRCCGPLTPEKGKDAIRLKKWRAKLDKASKRHSSHRVAGRLSLREKTRRIDAVTILLLSFACSSIDRVFPSLRFSLGAAVLSIAAVMVVIAQIMFRKELTDCRIADSKIDPHEVNHDLQ